MVLIIFAIVHYIPNHFSNKLNYCFEQSDMAFGLTTSSRLGCQVLVTEEMAGMEVRVPAATRNFYVDGHVAVPH